MEPIHNQVATPAARRTDHWAARLGGFVIAAVSCIAWAYVATLVAVQQSSGTEPDLEPGGRLAILMLWLTFTALVLCGGMTGYLVMRSNEGSVLRAIGLLNGGLAGLALTVGGLAATGALT